VMSKAAMNLQDSFLNQVRRENSEVNILLVNGKSLRGSVKGFDNFTVILNSRNGQHLIYKHAIAQLVSQRSMNMRREDGSTIGEESADGPEPTATEAGTTDSAPATHEQPQQHQQHHQQHHPNPNRPQNQQRRDNRDNRQNRENRGDNRGENRGDNRPKPKKDGFNQIDLSSVKLGEEQPQPVKVAGEES
jgi:host factor-I protein